MDLINRTTSRSMALETTLLVHGVPPGAALPLARELTEIAHRHEVHGAYIGVVRGRAIAGLNEEELQTLLEPPAPKANSANLGALMFRKAHAATTVSATLEIAAAAGIRIFATGGLGGVHQNYGRHLDISSDLAAMMRFPLAVIASGVKSILDVAATREALETLGIPVIGYQTDTFPAFYLRDTRIPVDARFDDVAELGAFVDAETTRSGRAILIVNPVPESDAILPAEWEQWLSDAKERTRKAEARGRDITPALLGHLHDISAGATLRANLALVRSNVELGARLCAAMQSQH